MRVGVREQVRAGGKKGTRMSGSEASPPPCRCIAGIDGSLFCKHPTFRASMVGTTPTLAHALAPAAPSSHEYTLNALSHTQKLFHA